MPCLSYFLGTAECLICNICMAAKIMPKVIWHVANYKEWFSPNCLPTSSSCSDSGLTSIHYKSWKHFLLISFLHANEKCKLCDEIWLILAFKCQFNKVYSFTH
jgi:hypothetical protein